MTVIDITHHLSVGADEGPTPFTVTGDSFIDLVSNQFTSINSMRSSSKQTALLPHHQYQILDEGYGIEWDQTWLGNPLRITPNSAINPIPDLLNSGIFIGIFFF
jgi:hypothetical protein